MQSPYCFYSSPSSNRSQDEIKLQTKYSALRYFQQLTKENRKAKPEIGIYNQETGECIPLVYYAGRGVIQKELSAKLRLRLNNEIVQIFGEEFTRAFCVCWRENSTLFPPYTILTLATAMDSDNLDAAFRVPNFRLVTESGKTLWHTAVETVSAVGFVNQPATECIGDGKETPKILGMRLRICSCCGTEELAFSSPAAAQCYFDREALFHPGKTLSERSTYIAALERLAVDILLETDEERVWDERKAQLRLFDIMGDLLMGNARQWESKVCDEVKEINTMANILFRLAPLIRRGESYDRTMCAREEMMMQQSKEKSKKGKTAIQKGA